MKGRASSYARFTTCTKDNISHGLKKKELDWTKMRTQFVSLNLVITSSLLDPSQYWV